MSFIPKFKKGDVIISNNGSRPGTVTCVPRQEWDCYQIKYLHNNRSNSFYGCNQTNYELYKDPEMTDIKTLYSFTKADGTVGYGTHIGTNSQNKLLIEEKGTGEIHVLGKEELEEVTPYTFSVKIDSAEYHYVGKPDTLKVGDILITSEASPRLAKVTGLDTKNKTPRALFKGRKLVTEEI